MPSVPCGHRELRAPRLAGKQPGNTALLSPGAGRRVPSPQRLEIRPRRGARGIMQAERSAPWELAKPMASGDGHGPGAPPAIGLGAPQPAESGLHCPGAGPGVGGSPQPQSCVVSRALTRPSLPRAAGTLEGAQCSRKSSGPGDSAGS